LLLASGSAVRIVDGETLRQRTVVADGAADFWHVVIWNGFRPRAGDLDQPVTIADTQSVAAPPDTTDTTSVAPVAGDTTGRPPRAPIPRPVPPRIPVDTGTPAPAAPARSGGWIVSFAAYLSEASARSRAAEITVEGQKARVVAGQTPGTTTTVYRVILGPYPTKADAERIGRESRESFWVYEGNP
jgi:cell division protein FtsN